MQINLKDYRIEKPEFKEAKDILIYSQKHGYLICKYIPKKTVLDDDFLDYDYVDEFDSDRFTDFFGEYDEDDYEIRFVKEGIFSQWLVDFVQDVLFWGELPKLRDQKESERGAKYEYIWSKLQ